MKLKPEQNGRYFVDHFIQMHFFKEISSVLNQNSMTCVNGRQITKRLHFLVNGLVSAVQVEKRIAEPLIIEFTNAYIRLQA